MNLQTAAMHKDRVLLVDDEPQVLVALEDLLRDKFTVYKTDSAAGALEIAGRDPDIAVVLTDQRMPRVSGEELLSRLGHTSDAVRILVTGFADLSAVIRAVNEGKIFAYVTKPWDAEELKATVSQAAQHYRLARELAAERQLLHDLMDNIPDGIYFKDRDLRFRRANRAFCSMLGLESPERLVGNTLAQALPLSSRAGFELDEADERRVLRVGAPLVDLVREKPGASSVHFYSDTKAPIRDSNGDVIGVVGIRRDVSDRVAMEEALRASEQRFREQTDVLHSILDSMADGVVVVDRDCRSLLFNSRARELLGAGATAAQEPVDFGAFGLCWLDGTPLPNDENPVLRSLREQRTVELELLINAGGRSQRILSLTATPLRETNSVGGDGRPGRVVGSVALVRDITEQRDLEQKLAQSQKMDAIGRLAGGVAHDFNNLLSVIQSYAQLLFTSLPDADPKREDVQQVLTASRRAAELTRQLLAFCRRQVVKPRLLDLNALITDLEKMLRRIIGEDIRLITKLADGEAQIEADLGQVEQVIVNLTVNARDAMPSGGVLTIETENVHSGRERGQVMLRVTDTGVGMESAVQTRIFEPFFTTKEVGKGTGLGLSTVYGIVQQSRGRIVVDSRPGLGSSFRIYFPQARKEAQPPPSEPASTEPAASIGTVLVVEDEELVRQLAVRILRARGHRVIEAIGPSEALALCTPVMPHVDVLLTDVVMPGANGPELARELVRRSPGLRVVFMSGYPGNALPETADPALAAEFLEKPFTPSALVDVISRALAKSARAARQRQ